MIASNRWLMYCVEVIHGKRRQRDIILNSRNEKNVRKKKTDEVGHNTQCGTGIITHTHIDTECLQSEWLPTIAHSTQHTHYAYIYIWSADIRSILSISLPRMNDPCLPPPRDTADRTDSRQSLPCIVFRLHTTATHAYTEMHFNTKVIRSFYIYMAQYNASITIYLYI